MKPLKSIFNAVLLLIFLVAIDDGSASINHGINTTFNPAAWGGAANVSCLTAAIPGTCSTGYNATCNGIANDDTALANWRTASIAANPARAVLYIPPGSNCNFVSCAVFVTADPCNGTEGTPGILNVVVWGYGATVNAAWFGGLDFYQGDEIHGALIQSANIGDTVLNLVTSAQSSRLAVGNYIYVDGLALQKGGFPPNWQFYETHRVIAINSGAITIDAPLKHKYLSTWPQIDDFNTGGPASIHILQTSWNVDFEVHGLTITGPGQVNVIGRNIRVYGTAFGSGGSGPSSSASIMYSNTSGGTELDKNVENMAIYSHSFSCSPLPCGNFTIQNPSAANLIINGMTLSGSLNGTAENVVVTNSKFSALRVGPTGFGAGGSLSISNTTFQTASSSTNLNIALSALSWDNAGTLSIPNNSASINVAWAIFVPGATYYFGESDGTDSSIPHTTFHVTGITTNGATTFYATDIPAGALPSPSCNSQPCLTVAVYSLTTVTQTNTGSSPSLTSFAVH